jgi:hypothetical protein
MTTPQEARGVLDSKAAELGRLSAALADVSRRLEPIDHEYEQFVTDFEAGLWKRFEDGDLSRLPSEKMRMRLAHKQIDQTLLGRREGLHMSRDRLRKRISDLRLEVEAQRSILSALKVEMEATR